jgi:hypothetical protein
VATRAPLNVRTAPTTAAARLRKAAVGDRLAFDGWTSSGEAVHGNPHWYRNDSGEYFWAGGTEAPIPALPAT